MFCWLFFLKEKEETNVSIRKNVNKHVQGMRWRQTKAKLLMNRMAHFEKLDFSVFQSMAVFCSRHSFIDWCDNMNVRHLDGKLKACEPKTKHGHILSLIRTVNLGFDIYVNFIGLIILKMTHWRIATHRFAIKSRCSILHSDATVQNTRGNIHLQFEKLVLRNGSTSI